MQKTAPAQRTLRPRGRLISCQRHILLTLSISIRSRIAVGTAGIRRCWNAAARSRIPARLGEGSASIQTRAGPSRATIEFQRYGGLQLKSVSAKPIISHRRPDGAREPMAEDEETATARYIANNVSTQLMLKAIIEIISTMADDPDGYRAGLRVKLLELADTMPLAAMAPAREDKVRAFVRETISTLLPNKPPN